MDIDRVEPRIRWERISKKTERLECKERLAREENSGRQAKGDGRETSVVKKFFPNARGTFTCIDTTDKSSKRRKGGKTSALCGPLMGMDKGTQQHLTADIVQTFQGIEVSLRLGR